MRRKAVGLDLLYRRGVLLCRLIRPVDFASPESKEFSFATVAVSGRGGGRMCWSGACPKLCPDVTTGHPLTPFRTGVHRLGKDVCARARSGTCRGVASGLGWMSKKRMRASRGRIRHQYAGSRERL